MKAISREELDRMNRVEDSDFVLINVLPRSTFNEQHIRTSINIPVEEGSFAEQVEAVAGGKKRDVVVYCASFDCNASSKAAEKLERAGFTNVYDYEGGTQDWFERKQAS